MDNYSYRGRTVVSNDGQMFQSATTSRSFMATVYLWMAGALVVTALAAIMTVSPYVSIVSGIQGKALSTEEALYAAMQISPLARFAFSGVGSIVLIVAELAAVLFLSFRIMKMSKTAAVISFLVYSTLNGITLSSIFIVYTSTSIVSAFFICAGMFAAMSAVGFITKKDLSGVGHICFMALIGLIIACVVNMFLRSPAFSYILSIATVLIFTALTAYDTQKLRNIQAQLAGETGDMPAKIAIFGALNLYLDFINIFLAVLRIFGNSRN
jgi:FtsH-binding integral membrane protein